MRVRLLVPPTLRRQTSQPRLELMPLLDVVFLLLTFFAFALLVMVQAEVLDVELPVLEAGRTAQGGDAPVVVTITADGSIAVDREPVEDESLIEQLEIRRSASPEGSEFALLLEVDVGAPSGRLIELVQTLRQAGFDRFGVLGSRGDQPSDDGPSSENSSSANSAPSPDAAR